MVQLLPDRIIYNDGTEHIGTEVDRVYSPDKSGSPTLIDTTPVGGMTVNSKVIIRDTGVWTPFRPYLITSRYDTIFQADVFTSSGTWVVPAGLTEVFALVAGGGGGGGNAVSVTAADGTVTNSGNDIGGAGGLTFGVIAVTPGASIPVTVGAGGTGSDTVNGTAGGTSVFSTLSATGGGVIATGTGASGVGSGGTLNGNVSTTLWDTIFSATGFGLPIFNEIYTTVVASMTPQTYTVNTNGNVAPLAWTTSSGFRPGCGGRGETPGSGATNASGGVQGAVVLFY